MTWIIAFPSIGYSSAVADIQVTVTEDAGRTRYVDCLQKIYPVGRWVLAGFCGNVRIGFGLVDDLRAWLRFSDNEPELAWIPEYVAFKWRRRARRIFATHAQKYPGGSTLVLAGVHPTRNASLLEGAMSYPVPYACIMRAPEFIPEPIPEQQVASVGSGNNVAEYRAMVEKLKKHPQNLMWGDFMGAPGQSASILAHTLGLDVEKSPAPGISKHFHVGIVRRGAISIEPNDWEVIHPGGRREIKRAPECAKDWDSLQRRLALEGIRAIDASQA